MAKKICVIKTSLRYNSNSDQLADAFIQGARESGVGTLQTLVVALGAGLGIWGAINLMQSSLEAMGLGSFFAVFMQSMVVHMGIHILSIAIFVIINGRITAIPEAAVVGEDVTDRLMEVVEDLYYVYEADRCLLNLLKKGSPWYKFSRIYKKMFT